MKKSYYGLKSFLRHKGRKHFCKGETLTSMLNRMAFQQVPYEKLSQRTFSFLIRLPPSIYLRHSPHEKINRCLTDINRCLTDISRYLTDTENQF